MRRVPCFLLLTSYFVIPDLMMGPPSRCPGDEQVRLAPRAAAMPGAWRACSSQPHHGIHEHGIRELSLSAFMDPDFHQDDEQHPLSRRLTPPRPQAKARPW